MDEKAGLTGQREGEARFPPQRLKIPRPGTEVVVDDQPTDSCIPGHARCGLNPPPEAAELDFVVGIEGVDCIGIQVKDGKYLVKGTA